MKLVTFKLLVPSDDTPRLGVLVGSEVTEVSGSMQGLISGGANALQTLRRETKERLTIHPASTVRLLAPLPRPARNLLCVGKNYHDHAKEFAKSGFDATSGKDPIPEWPI